jgi:hypothetical protein
MKEVFMKRMALVFTILILFFSMENPGQAQDDESPLLEMLSYMPPPSTETGSIISYADMELALSARLEVPEVNSIEDFEALSESERNIYKQSLPMILPIYMSRIVNEELFRAVSEGFGLNFFGIEQSLHPITYGVFREPYVSLRGNFDADTFINPRLELGYSQHRVEDWIIICPEINCEEEEQRNGQWLLNEKYILGTDLLIMMQSIDYLTRTEAILTGDAPSLLDMPDYAASASLLTEAGSVSQAIFLEPDTILTANEFRGVDIADVAVLPPYELVSVAELVFPEGRYTEVHIVLSYENADDAAIASANLEHNLNDPNAFNAANWESLDAHIEEVEVIEDKVTDLFLVRAVLSSPMGLDGTSLRESSLFRMIFTTSFGFSTASWLRVEE